MGKSRGGGGGGGGGRRRGGRRPRGLRAALSRVTGALRPRG